jgi:hypothetical protein
MPLASQIGCIVVLLSIFFQDMNERKVYIWLFISAGILMGYLHILHTSKSEFLRNSALNFVVISLVYYILFLYAHLKLKENLSNVFGVGDLMFFLIMALSFPTTTFIILFTFSLIFSLVLFYLIKSKMQITYVPLAGFQSLFLVLILATNWVFNFIDLYKI